MQAVGNAQAWTAFLPGRRIRLSHSSRGRGSGTNTPLSSQPFSPFSLTPSPSPGQQTNLTSVQNARLTDFLL